VAQEDLSISKLHLWYDLTTQSTEGAFMIINTAGRDVVIPKIDVRGQPVAWSSVFYVSGTFALTSDLPYLTDVADSAPTTISDGAGGFLDLIPAKTDLTLQSGYCMVIYINNPDSI